MLTEGLVFDDPVTKGQLWYHFDPVSETMMLQESHDVEPIIERNRRLKNGPATVSKTKEWELIASIPGHIHWMLKKQGVIVSMHEDPHQRRLLRWLKEHPDFRTSYREIAK